MEIMKTWNTDFKFDLQRFAAAYTLDASIIVSGVVGLKKGTGNDLVVCAADDANILATVSSGAITWTSAADDNDTIAITANSATTCIFSGISAGSGSKLASVDFLAKAGSGVTVAKDDLGGVSVSGTSITVDGVDASVSGTLTDSVTFTDSASLTDTTNTFAVSAGKTATAVYNGTNTWPVVSLTSGNSISVSGGTVGAYGTGSITLGAGATVKTHQTASALYAAADDELVTGTGVVSVSTGTTAKSTSLTLNSGTFTVVTPETGGDIAINATGALTIAGDMSFTADTVGTYSAENTAAITAGEMTLLATGPATYAVSAHGIV